MPRLVRLVALLAALVLVWPSASAAPASPQSSDSTTVRFTSERTYVVSATVGGRVLTGRGVLPDGLDPASVTARPARNVLGSRGVEVLVDYGSPVSDMTAHAYAVLTLHRGRLRPVLLDRRPLTLVTYTEGGDDGGFRCAGGRLVIHWFHHGSGQGEEVAYKLAGKRLKKVSRRTIRQQAPIRPETCA